MDFLNMTVADLNRKKVVEAAEMMKESDGITLQWSNLTAMQKKYLLCVICKLSHIVVVDSLKENNIKL